MYRCWILTIHCQASAHMSCRRTLAEIWWHVRLSNTNGCSWFNVILFFICGSHISYWPTLLSGAGFTIFFHHFMGDESEILCDKSPPHYIIWYRTFNFDTRHWQSPKEQIRKRDHSLTILTLCNQQLFSDSWQSDKAQYKKLTHPFFFPSKVSHSTRHSFFLRASTRHS